MAEGNQTKAVIGQTFVELCETKRIKQNQHSKSWLRRRRSIDKPFIIISRIKSIDSLDLQNRCADLSNI